MTEKSWTTNDIADLSGKSAIVTGANSGIGVETAKALAEKGVQIAEKLWDVSEKLTGIKYSFK